MQGQIRVPLLALLALLVSILLLGLVARRSWGKDWRGPWATVRQVVGWGCLVIGLLGLILPGPGIPLLIIGVALVGWRHPLLRRAIVVLKLHLRSWARQPGFRGWIGTRGKRPAHVLSMQLRRAYARAKE